MKILSVTSRKARKGAVRESRTIEATIGVEGDFFQVDFDEVCRRLAGIVPFQTQLGGHAMPLSTADIPALLLKAAEIGANSAEVGRDVHARYLFGVAGIGTAWDVRGLGNREHLWRAEGSALCGPVPRDATTDRPLPVILTVTVESLSDHSLAPFASIIKPLIERAGTRIARALR